MENWKVIPSIPHCEASDLGRIKISDRVSIGGCRGIGNTCVKLLKSKILSPSKAGRYQVVRIGKKNYYVHRLVAETWCDRKPGCNQVNHKNGDKRDNSCNNLEWVTARENVLHSWKSGLSKKRIVTESEIKMLSDIKKKKVLNTKTGVLFDSITEAANYYKIPLSTLSTRIKEGKADLVKLIK